MGFVFLERLADRIRIVSIDHGHIETRCLQLGGGSLGRLLRADCIGLPVAIAVENRADFDEVVVGQKADRLPDLAFPAFAIADEAKDSLIQAVESGCQRQPCGDR